MILRYLAIFSLFVLIQACDSAPVKQNDLNLAKVAMQDREWFSAERLLERFLNSADDAEMRWEAWQALLETARHTGTNFSVMRIYYDNMLQEFLEEDKRKIVLYGLAKLLEENEDYDAATDMWTIYLSLDNLETNEIFEATQKVIEIYLHTGQFDAAENALYNCLGLEISAQDSAICLYELADLKAGRGALKEAIDLATQVLEVESYASTRGQAAFLLGDIAEQQGNYVLAHEFFEQAKKFYPNVLAVENRIAYLDNLLKK